MLDYPALATGCQTQNEFNRLHIDLENVLAPLEIAGIAEGAAARELPRPSKAWLANVRLMCADMLDDPRLFRRREISPFVNVYQEPGGTAAEKSLLIGFAGNARRLMLPASVMLQCLEPGAWDVVILRRCARNSFLRGIEGIASDLTGLVQHLRGALAVERYRRVLTLGTSGGGYAAAWAAILLRADRGVCVGGSMPQPASDAGDPPLLYRPCATPHAVDLAFAFGLDFLRDMKSALALQDLFGGRLRPVPGIDQHGVFKVLLARGELPAFLKEVLS